MKILINQIEIGDRQRVELGDMTGLVDSFKELGQIVPITVYRPINSSHVGYVLDTGRRRLEAAKLLNWTEIEAHYAGELTPLEKEERELDEDIRRKDRTWWEKAIAMKRLWHLKKVSSEDGWTTKKMSALVEVSDWSVSALLRLADYPVEELKKYPAANPAYKELILLPQERAANAEIERRRQLAAPIIANGAVSVANPTEPEQALEKVVIKLQYEPNDFKMNKLDDASVDLAIANYLDTDDIPVLDRVLSPTGYAVVFLRPMQWDEAGFFFRDHGFNVMPFPLVWNQLVSAKDTRWPFLETWRAGLVVTKNKEIKAINPATAVMQAMVNDGNIPFGVVQHVCKALILQDKPVVIINGVMPHEVAQCGNIPVWFEADELKRVEKIKALTEYYQDNVPGVEVVI